MFSFESRRAHALIPLDCETGLTSCIILTREVFTAGVLKRKNWTNWGFVKVDWFSWFIEFELYFIFYLWATIIKIGISYQVSIMFKVSGVIQFTDVIDSFILWLFFEVSTDAVVIHVAGKTHIDPSLWRVQFRFCVLPNVCQKRRSNLETSLCDLALK